LSPNNHILASAPDDCTVCLWNLGTNRQIGLPLLHESDVQCIALSGDGKALVTACIDGNVCVWDMCAILKEAGLDSGLLSIPDVSEYIMALQYCSDLFSLSHSVSITVSLHTAASGSVPSLRLCSSAAFLRSFVPPKPFLVKQPNCTNNRKGKYRRHHCTHSLPPLVSQDPRHHSLHARCSSRAVMRPPIVGPSHSLAPSFVS
jgi:hypothetical protein